MMFIKPRTALIGPSPGPTKIPRFVQDDSSDYEAELAVIISRSGRDIPEASAMDYVLDYTCSNDVSARREQFKIAKCHSLKVREKVRYFLVGIRSRTISMTLSDSRTMLVQAWIAPVPWDLFLSSKRRSIIPRTFASRPFRMGRWFGILTLSMAQAVNYPSVLD